MSGSSHSHEQTEGFLISHVLLLLRLAGVVAIVSGLIGGYIWMNAWADRDDGDALRWGYFHNPFMQFPPFDEPFLDLSIYVLLACSAAAGLGGIMLLIPLRWGARLVAWQARVSIVTNGVTAFFIVAMMSIFAEHQWDEWHLGGTREALILRLGSMAVDVVLWTFLRSTAVSGFFAWRRAHSPRRAFEVIIQGDRSAR